jgi:type IV pilus assembly protein PilM
MPSFRSNYPIAIDVGSQNLYAIQLKQNRQGFAVRGLVHRELNWEVEGMGEASDDLVYSLKEIGQHKQFYGKRAVIQLPMKHVSSFPIHIQVGETETLEDSIIRESKERLPFPIEQAVIDYPSITPLTSGDGAGYRATIIAVRRDLIEQYLLIFKRAGLNVEVVDFAVSSLIRLHKYLFPPNQDPVILCNVGYTQSMLAVVTQDSILAHRSIPSGLDVLLKKIQTSLELSNDKDKAKIFLRRYGLVYEDRETCSNTTDDARDAAVDNSCRVLYQVIAPYIEKWILEFHKIMAYVRSEDHDRSIAGIYLYGYAPLVHKLDRYLERRLNIQTKIVNPIKEVSLPDDSILADISDGGPFGLALGLGMRKESWL